MITILGLGYGDPNALTLEAHTTLTQAREIFLRTRQHPTVAALPKHLRLHSFDYLYKKSSDLNAVYSGIADAILARSVKGDVLYAVPGHPLFGEISVQKILAAARERNLETRLIAGVSFVDAACAALSLDPLAHGLQIADATDMARQHFPQLDPNQPTLIGQMYSRAVASDCKLTLLELYPPEHPVTRVDAAGTSHQKLEVCALAELDRTDQFGLLTSLYVPPLARPGSLNGLAEIVAHLRAPEGCPWDREQTHQSLRKDLLEECYEVLETLDADDIPHLREELGDLLLHILLQTQIASEAGEFSLSQVAAEISEKLVRRHPHVFANVQVRDTAEIVANWDQIKLTENGGKPKKTSSVPRGLPALARAQKIAKWVDTNIQLDAIAAAVKKLARARNREQALGAVLFALAAYARAKHLDAEGALRQVANENDARILEAIPRK